MDSEVVSLPPEVREGVDRLASDWTAGGHVGRLWSRDAALWTGGDESRWLGWLDIAGTQLEHLGPLQTLQQDIAHGPFDHAVLLGMGGSSLCPDVLRQSFGRVAGAPDLRVLDSTDPEQVRSVEQRIDLRRTLFIVSSKSGTTLEPTLLYRYFRHRVQSVTGGDKAGAQFIAVTDPGSQLEQDAVAGEFRQVYHGVPDIGGRYSALSHFGMVPAAVMGLDVECLLSRAAAVRARCTTSMPLADNPGVMLGLTLGAAVRTGRDKVTFVVSPGIRELGAWLEQLLAESTGKRATGVIPVDGESVGPPQVYGGDRLFVYLRDASAPDTAQDEAVAGLADAGLPVVRFSLADRYDLGGEFFRWEFATAVVGAVLGVNPFDQPDVEASKIETRRLTDAFEAKGALPPEAPLAQDEQLELYADPANARVLGRGDGTSVDQLIARHCARAGERDHLAILAYVEMSPAHRMLLQRLRHALRDTQRVASCVGFGPRFLHSTGQVYKGVRTVGCFSKSRAAMRPIWRCRVGVTALVWSRRPKRVAISRCSRLVGGASSACMWSATSWKGWTGLSMRWSSTPEPTDRTR